MFAKVKNVFNFANNITVGFTQQHKKKEQKYI